MSRNGQEHSELQQPRLKWKQGETGCGVTKPWPPVPSTCSCTAGESGPLLCITEGHLCQVSLLFVSWVLPEPRAQQSRAMGVRACIEGAGTSGQGHEGTDRTEPRSPGHEVLLQADLAGRKEVWPECEARVASPKKGQVRGLQRWLRDLDCCSPAQRPNECCAAGLPSHQH